MRDGNVLAADVEREIGRNRTLDIHRDHDIDLHRAIREAVHIEPGRGAREIGGVGVTQRS